MNQSKIVDELEDDEDDVEGAAIDDADEVEGQSRRVINELQGDDTTKTTGADLEDGPGDEGLFSMMSRKAKAMPSELRSMMSRTSRAIAGRAAIERQTKRRRTIKKKKF